MPLCCLVQPGSTQICLLVQVERVIFLKQDAAGGPLKYLCKVTSYHLKTLHRCAGSGLNNPSAQLYFFQSAQAGALLQACFPLSESPLLPDLAVLLPGVLTGWYCCSAEVEGLALWGVHLGDVGGCAESWRLPGSSGLCGGLVPVLRSLASHRSGKTACKWCHGQ